MTTTTSTLSPASSTLALGSTKKRARTRSFQHHPLATLVLLLACWQHQPSRFAQAISPSRLLASFASQQQQRANLMGRAGSRHRTAATVFRNAAAAGTTYAPSPYGGGSTSKQRSIGGRPSASAFIAGAGGGNDGGVGEFWGTATREWSRDLAAASRRPQDVASSMGLSGLGGMAAGYVAKRFGKFLSFACGFVLVSMKVAEEFGYVAVNWQKIEDDTRSLGESVWGREGKVRRRAEKLARSWQQEVGAHAGIAGSFLAGFAYAFKAT